MLPKYTSNKDFSIKIYDIFRMATEKIKILALANALLIIKYRSYCTKLKVKLFFLE